eukprot:COSAG06_NODE_17385_length_944_cov_1.263905_2_plen_110_part_01
MAGTAINALALQCISSLTWLYARFARHTSSGSRPRLTLVALILIEARSASNALRALAAFMCDFHTQRSFSIYATFVTMRTNPLGIAVGVLVATTLYAACVIGVWSLAKLA